MSNVEITIRRPEKGSSGAKRRRGPIAPHLKKPVLARRLTRVLPGYGLLTLTDVENEVVLFKDLTDLSVQVDVNLDLTISRPHSIGIAGPLALVADFANSKVHIVNIAQEAVVATIDTAGKYDGTGPIAVSPNRQKAIASGQGTSVIISAPFNEGSEVTTFNPGVYVTADQTQSIVFDAAGKAYINGIASESGSAVVVFPSPYTSPSTSYSIPGGQGGCVAVTQDGSIILATASNDKVFIRGSATDEITLPGSGPTWAKGIAISPDEQTAIVVDSFNFGGSGPARAWFIQAPFTSSSVVEEIPMPSGALRSFEDVGITDEYAILTGNGDGNANKKNILVTAPFTAAGATVENMVILEDVEIGRGAAAARFFIGAS